MSVAPNGEPLDGGRSSGRRSLLDRWLRLPWWAILFGAALLVALLNRGPPPEPAPPRELPAAPFLLVATGLLQDGVFDGTVVLVFAHAPGGAGGLVINRRAADGGETPGELFWGGPVDLEDHLVLSRRALPGSERVAPDLHVLLHPDLARAALTLRGAGVRVYRGYAGWSAGQLEREVAGGVWDVAPADPALVFAAELEAIRPAALARPPVGRRAP